MYTTTGTEIAC